MCGNLPGTSALLAVLGPVCPCTIIPSFLPWRQSCNKRYQALSRFSILQATESWVEPRNMARRPWYTLVFEAWSTSAREGSLWWTVYTSHVLLHCTVQSNHVAVFCHTYVDLYGIGCECSKATLVVHGSLGHAWFSVCSNVSVADWHAVYLSIQWWFLGGALGSPMPVYWFTWSIGSPGAGSLVHGAGSLVHWCRFTGSLVHWFTGFWRVCVPEASPHIGWNEVHPKICGMSR